MSSQLAANHWNQQQAEQEERMRMKKLTLDINERQEQEDYQGGRILWRDFVQLRGLSCQGPAQVLPLRVFLVTPIRIATAKFLYRKRQPSCVWAQYKFVICFLPPNLQKKTIFNWHKSYIKGIGLLSRVPHLFDDRV